MELTDQQITDLQELLKKDKAVEPVAQTQVSQGFNLNLGGNKYQVRDSDEAQRLIDQYEAQRQQEVEAERVRNLALEQRTQQLQAQLPQRQQAQQDGFDKEEYARLFLDDPRKASRYALQHDPEQIQFYQGLVSQINQVKQEAAASQFLLQHKEDYEATPGNFKALEAVISQFNLPWDINGLNLAYTVAKGSGAIQVEQDQQGRRQQQEVEDGFEEPQAQQRFAPRVSRRRTTTSQAEDSQVLAQFESLSPDKMKAYLESLASR